MLISKFWKVQLLLMTSVLIFTFKCSLWDDIPFYFSSFNRKGPGSGSGLTLRYQDPDPILIGWAKNLDLTGRAQDPDSVWTGRAQDSDPVLIRCGSRIRIQFEQDGSRIRIQFEQDGPRIWIASKLPRAKKNLIKYLPSCVLVHRHEKRPAKKCKSLRNSRYWDLCKRRKKARLCTILSKYFYISTRAKACKKINIKPRN